MQTGHRGHSYLETLRKRWVGMSLLAALLISLSALILLVFISAGITNVSVLIILAVTLGVYLFTLSVWGTFKIHLTDIANLLNRSFPQLEESAALFIKPADSLNLLEKLQVQKIEPLLIAVPVKKLLLAQLKLPLIFLIASVGLGFTITKLYPAHTSGTPISEAAGVTKPDKILPGITSVELTISPPAYTKLPTRKQSQFSVSAEDGSSLQWKITTSKAVGSMKLIINDRETLSMKSDADSTSWTLTKIVSKTGFYQVEMDRSLSELYKLEIIKDQPSVIRIISPDQYSTIDFGEPQRTYLKVSITDDYGVNAAYISATISSGKGEGVKFREQRLNFTESINGASRYNLQKTIDLKSLGMVPGDELYFYIQARDSRQQDSRSDMYIVYIQDTAQLMSIDGMLGGVNLVPEYFRSQRQIIIDTEKLLRDRPSISAPEFNTRSNDLGVDQKLLRLRYGKFLGEESETEIGGGHEHEEDHEPDPKDFGNAEKLMDAVAHKHDVAEDATFFEPELKAQLKAVLEEMWKSELRLRTYKPAEALPFEYKALRLLKDLQQKSRVYVAKTSFKPPVIKADKRLSGELDKITQPQNQRQKESQPDPQSALRQAAAILAQVQPNSILSAEQTDILRNASQMLTSQAAANPAMYLKPLGILRSYTSSGQTGKAKQLVTVQAALQKILKNGASTPQAGITPPGSSLSDQYFENLKRNLR